MVNSPKISAGKAQKINAGLTELDNLKAALIMAIKICS